MRQLVSIPGRSPGHQLATGQAFLSLGASKLVRALTGLPLTDVTSGFKGLSAARRFGTWTGAGLLPRGMAFKWNFITSLGNRDAG